MQRSSFSFLFPHLFVSCTPLAEILYSPLPHLPFPHLHLPFPYHHLPFSHVPALLPNLTSPSLPFPHSWYSLKMRSLIWTRVSICKTFGERNAKFFFCCASVLREKNSNLRNHSQKSFHAKLSYSAFSHLEFCAIPQFRYNHMQI